ncbi:MAG: hypothetical protein IJ555_03040 [Ruminococcus sp.]|nr:hypothetical protein [Ruminococcus sp.]
MIEFESTKENGFKIICKGELEELAAETGVLLKHIITEARKKGATEEKLTVVLCAIQNFALGYIPEK